MTRRACVAIDFDIQYPGQIEDVTADLRHHLTAYRNLEVTILDRGAAHEFPTAQAGGPAQHPATKKEHKP